ncbi:MAG: hypothetical protein JNM18_07385 [Planctomycetaceae bacterium]|nr:hypothetical protein [Planctomycetaceae bacterium]
MAQSGVCCGAPPDSVGDLLNRHVLESLAHAVQPSSGLSNPMQDRRVWSRRAIVEQLDQQALAAAKLTNKPTTVERVAEAQVQPRSSVSLPSPTAQVESLLPLVPVQAVVPTAAESRVPSIVRDLPELLPLRGPSEPASSQKPALLKTPPVEVGTNVPARLTVPQASEPIRSDEPSRGIEQASWNRPAKPPIESTGGSSPARNPLRATHTVSGAGNVSSQLVNPLRP